MRIYNIAIICFYISSMASIHGQSNAELYLKGNKLKGSCENPYFTGFNIELDTIYEDLDSSSLFSQFPRIGKINFRNRVDIPTEFTLTERSGKPQIMFRFKTTYLTFDDLSIQSQSITFTIDNDPDVPATEDDLKIIRLAKRLLSEEKYWNKADDRQCNDDLANKSYSLYCALRLSSLEIEDRYNHRNAVLQKLRRIIEVKHPNVKWKHRLMDFNNMAETNYEDITGILNEIENDFIQEMNLEK